MDNGQYHQRNAYDSQWLQEPGNPTGRRNSQFIDSQDQPQNPPMNTADSPKPKWDVYSIVTSKYGAAVIAFVSVFLLLMWQLPPFATRDISTNPYKKEIVVNWTVVFIWSAAAALTVLVVEPVTSLVKTYL